MGDAARVHGADGFEQVVEEFRPGSGLAEWLAWDEVQHQPAVLDQAMAFRDAGQAGEPLIGAVFAPQCMPVDGKQRAAAGGRLDHQLPVPGVEPVDHALVAARQHRGFGKRFRGDGAGDRVGRAGHLLGNGLARNAAVAAEMAGAAFAAGRVGKLQ